MPRDGEHRARQRRYELSERGREMRRRRDRIYAVTPKGLERTARYRATTKGILNDLRGEMRRVERQADAQAG